MSKSVKLFSLFCGLFWLIGLWLNIAFTQKELFFWVNRHNTAFMDAIMPYFTDLGDGVFAIIAGILILVFLKIRHGLAFIAGYLLEGIFVQIMKRLVFTNRPRPWARYASEDFVHLVNGFKPYSNNSFPSGHTATVFCMAALIVFIWPKLKGGWFFFFPAIMVAYSRIYLSQHYFIDVYAGSMVGFASALIIYYYFYRPKNNFAGRFQWMDKPLLRIK